MQTFYQASIKGGAFEAATLAALREQIATHYAERGTQEPLVDYIMHFSGDDEVELTPLELRVFNRELESEFHAERLAGHYHEQYVREVSDMGGRL